MGVQHHLVMVVDDDDDIREALRDLLQDEGYEVVLADNGREALDLLRQGASPCMILLDLMMPVMDGWQFRKEQREDERLSSIPVVVITAAGRVDSIDVDVLSKPLEASRVIDVVKRYCDAPRPIA